MSTAATFSWPNSALELDDAQAELAAAARSAAPWRPSTLADVRVGAVFAVFPSGQRGPGVAGQPAWAAAAMMQGEAVLATGIIRGESGAGYEPGRLALQRGALLEATVRSLDVAPDVLIVNATGRDHPRRAGLAIHLGAVLDVPTIGVTDHPLVAAGDAPGPERGDVSSLDLDSELVGYVVRASQKKRPVVVHAGWRTDAETARDVVMATTAIHRTPQPLRLARFLARVERARGEGRSSGPPVDPTLAPVLGTR